MSTILVVEDEAMIRENMVELLEAEGFTVLTAAKGQAALRLAQSHLPDLIICDVVLPDFSGYQVLSRLCQDSNTALIPFVFVTARADKQAIRQGMQAGADDYLIKPFTRAELLSTISSRLHKQTVLRDRYTLILRQAAERLNRLVHYDSLTDLPNHLLFRERLCQSLAQAQSSGQAVALLYLSLNRLHRINNLLGYPSGDELLRSLASRLSECTSAGDTVARLTGSQFGLILTGLGDRHAVVAATQAILDILAQPFCLSCQELFITVSIGITLCPEQGQDVNTLLRQADAAMNRAKRQKGSHYHIYTPNLALIPDNQISLETSLQYGLQRQEFQLYYQPQLSLHTQHIEGVEALIRWYHPQRGQVSPAEFIPLAEESGLIVPIGEWVLRTACAQARCWENQGFPPLRMSVNISGYQFTQPGLTQIVADILQETQLDPTYLELELTETTLMQNLDVSMQMLTALKELGVRIAIDDFGTGYSSLSYLKQFPIDALKIDHGFVRNIWDDAKNMAITKAVMQMAHDLQLCVIAEGVETEAELNFLQQHPCDLVQGYLIGCPMAAIAFETQLAESGCLKGDRPFHTL